jgi:hypothetical protein
MDKFSLFRQAGGDVHCKRKERQLLPDQLRPGRGLARDSATHPRFGMPHAVFLPSGQQSSSNSMNGSVTTIGLLIKPNTKKRREST